MLAEGAAPAGDLSEEVDEVQSYNVKLPGEEEGYDADSESNPENMAKQEEGRSTLTTSLPHFYTVRLTCKGANEISSGYFKNAISKIICFWRR